MESHLVRCFGAEWRLRHDRGQRTPFSFRTWLGLPRKTIGTPRSVYWNGTQSPSDRPAWLPIAWICCEADAEEGPKFAAAILDADPGDDTPALIACEWLEGRGTLGVFGGSGGRAHEGWGFRVNGSRWILQGPIHTWARDLISASCIGCGGSRGGDDEIELLGPGDRPLGMAIPRREARWWDDLARQQGCAQAEYDLPDCPLCGFPMLLAPPPLEIPEVVG